MIRASALSRHLPGTTNTVRQRTVGKAITEQESERIKRTAVETIFAALNSTPEKEPVTFFARDKLPLRAVLRGLLKVETLDQRVPRSIRAPRGQALHSRNRGKGRRPCFGLSSVVREHQPRRPCSKGSTPGFTSHSRDSPVKGDSRARAAHSALSSQCCAWLLSAPPHGPQHPTDMRRVR